MEVDLEKMGRFGSISRTGLMLAAMGNHPKVYTHVFTIQRILFVTGMSMRFSVSTC